MNKEEPIIIRKALNGYYVTPFASTMSNDDSDSNIADMMMFHNISVLSEWMKIHFQSEQDAKIKKLQDGLVDLIASDDVSLSDIPDIDVLICSACGTGFMAVNGVDDEEETRCLECRLAGNVGPSDGE